MKLYHILRKMPVWLILNLIVVNLYLILNLMSTAWISGQIWNAIQSRYGLAFSPISVSLIATFSMIAAPATIIIVVLRTISFYKPMSKIGWHYANHRVAHEAVILTVNAMVIFAINTSSPLETVLAWTVATVLNFAPVVLQMYMIRRFRRKYERF